MREDSSRHYEEQRWGWHQKYTNVDAALGYLAQIPRQIQLVCLKMRLCIWGHLWFIWLLIYIFILFRPVSSFEIVPDAYEILIKYFDNYLDYFVLFNIKNTLGKAISQSLSLKTAWCNRVGTWSIPPGNHQWGSCSLQNDKPVFSNADCSLACSRKKQLC